MKLRQSSQSIKSHLRSQYNISRADAEDLLRESELLIRYNLTDTINERIDDLIYKLEYLYESALGKQEEDIELARKILKDLKDIYIGTKVDVKAKVEKIEWVWNIDQEEENETEQPEITQETGGVSEEDMPG